MKELIANGYGIAVNVSLAILAVLCVGLAVRWLIQKSWLVASGVLIDICGRNFNWLVFAFAVVGACLYGGAKNGAGQEALNGLGLNGSLWGTNAQHGRSDSDFTADSPEDNLSFISFSMSSNIASFGLSWKTNISPARAWLELYEKLHSLTNPWLPRLVRELPAHATNDAFTVTFTNDVPPAAFYSVHMDSLHVDFPDVEMTESADGRRVYTSFGPKSFAVAVNRPQRPDGFPPFDPAFAVNPFVYVDGLTYDPDASTLRADGYGVYELPDGSVLAAFANGLASNPDFMDHGNDLLSSIGTLGDLMSLSSLSPSSLANFQSFVDAVAGKGMSPNADVMARLRDLYERLKHGPLRIYGILEYEVCVQGQ